MKENKSSIFQNAIMVLIALCAVAITSIMVYQLTLGNKQIASLEVELVSCKSQIESQANALTEAGEQLSQYEAHLAQYKQQLDSYAEKAKEKTYALQKDIQPVSKGNAEAPSSVASSPIGAAIKMVSIIALVLCVIGSLIVIGESFAIGLAMLIISVLFGLISYGIGEIICLLRQIKEKIS